MQKPGARKSTVYKKLKENETKRQWAICIEGKNKRYPYDSGNIEEKWENIKQTIHEAGEEVLGTEEERRKEWISEHTWSLIKQRKHLKAKLNAGKTIDEKKEIARGYENLDTEVKRSARQDKRMWINNTADKAEETAKTNNMRELYRNTKTIAKKNYNQGKPIQSKTGSLITTPGEQLLRWQEYYEELLKEENMEDDDKNSEAENTLDIIESEPTREEIREAVKNMRNRKSPGIDNIPSELCKADLNYTVKMLTPLIQELWKQEQMPQEWSNGVLVKLWKRS